MSANLTCRLHEDQEAEEEEEEEDLQQPVFSILVLVAVGRNGRATQILQSESRHTIHAKKHFQNPCYH